MKADIHNLPKEGLSLDFEVNYETFESLREMVDNGECEFLTPIHVKLTVTPGNDVFLVDGCFETQIRLNCNRCLSAYDTQLSDSFSLTFTQKIVGMEYMSGATEIELNAEEMGQVFFQGEEIEFYDTIQEQVVMAFPIQSRCNDNCKGLCSKCGNNLNTNECSCDATLSGSQFEILRRLKDTSLSS